MRVLLSVFLSIGVGCLQSVLGDGYVISPSPRRIPPELLEEAKVNLPESVLQRLSLKQLSLVGETQNLDTESDRTRLEALPCAGLPPDATNVHHVQAGGGVDITWTTVHRAAAECTMTLMCHDDEKAETIVERAVLWRGRCGHRRGEMSKRVEIPSQMSATHFGQCWIQWRMETGNEDVFVQCVDIMVEPSGPGSTSSSSITTSTESTTSISPTTTSSITSTSTLSTESTTTLETSTTTVTTVTEWTTSTSSTTEYTTTFEDTTTIVHFTTDSYTVVTEITTDITETTVTFVTPTPTSTSVVSTTTSSQPSSSCPQPSPSTVYVTVTLVTTVTPPLPTNSITLNGETVKMDAIHLAHTA